MQIFDSLSLPPMPETIVALGTFDGVHRGHREVIGAAVAAAREAGAASAVFTFPGLPKNEFLKEDARITPLVTFSAKAALIEALGVDYLIAPEFACVKDVPAEEFVTDIIIGKLRAIRVVCGEDHRFGAGGRGCPELLEKLCSVRGVKVTVVPPVTCEGEKISSTMIRRLISEGRLGEANRLLGREMF